MLDMLMLLPYLGAEYNSGLVHDACEQLRCIAKGGGNGVFAQGLCYAVDAHCMPFKNIEEQKKAVDVVSSPECCMKASKRSHLL